MCRYSVTASNLASPNSSSKARRWMAKKDGFILPHGKHTVILFTCITHSKYSQERKLAHPHLDLEDLLRRVLNSYLPVNVCGFFLFLIHHDFENTGSYYSEWNMNETSKRIFVGNCIVTSKPEKYWPKETSKQWGHSFCSSRGTVKNS